MGIRILEDLPEKRDRRVENILIIGLLAAAAAIGVLAMRASREGGCCCSSSCRGQLDGPAAPKHPTGPEDSGCANSRSCPGETTPRADKVASR